MNALVGIEKIKNIIGMCGKNIKNENDERLIDLCSKMKLKISKAFFPLKMMHKYTWRQGTSNLKSIIH